jgi:hypothetical protein
MKILNVILLGLCGLALSACIYPYELVEAGDVEALLVIEGDILVNDSTRVKLSYTTPLGQEKPSLISKATVFVEDTDGGRYFLAETASGLYEADTHDLDPQLQYRLYIELPNQRRYASGYVPVGISPPVDSLGYMLQDGRAGVHIHVSTHDPRGKSRYYRWKYTEVWEFHAPEFSEFSYDIVNFRYVNRPYEENLYYCWASQSSTAILLGSSARLSEDVIYRAPVQSIWADDRRVSLLYSIKLQQKVLSKEGYEYWETLRKNSEDMGGVFSPQPSEQRGNIYSLDDPNEIILGYISACSVSYSDRLFIHEQFRQKEAICAVSTLSPYETTGALALLRNGMIPIKYDDFGEMIWLFRSCADCTLFGTKSKPSWWPNTHI